MRIETVEYKIYKYNEFIDRETDKKVRLKSVDRLGNISYFEALKN